MKAAPPNPWGLTYMQILSMDAMVNHGSLKLAAEAIGKSTKTLGYHLTKTNERMGCRTMLLKYIAYDRWRRGDGK